MLTSVPSSSVAFGIPLEPILVSTLVFEGVGSSATALAPSLLFEELGEGSNSPLSITLHKWNIELNFCTKSSVQNKKMDLVQMFLFFLKGVAFPDESRFMQHTKN